MKFIAHRGNVSGKNPALENTHAQIEAAIDLGFDVEIDVWYSEGSFYLGHDRACEITSSKFLLDSHLWCHAKNIKALHALMNIGAHCFAHNTDDVVLTSKGYLWTFPGKALTNKSVCVLPEKQQYLDLFECHGICSDEISKYKQVFDARS